MLTTTTTTTTTTTVLWDLMLDTFWVHSHRIRTRENQILST